MPSNQKFGWLFTAIFALGFGYFQWSYSFGWSIFSAFLATLFAFVTIISPNLLEPLNKVWFRSSKISGEIVSLVVLSVIFFALITPYAVTMRLFGRDALLLKKRLVSSYWVDRESIDPESFKNQF